MRIAASALGAAVLSAAATLHAQSSPVPPWGTTPSTPPAQNAGESTAPESPAAHGDGADVVTLRDGSVVRGTVVHLSVGESVTVRVASGELRVIAWTEVVGARGPAFAPSSTASASEEGSRDDSAIPSSAPALPPPPPGAITRSPGDLPDELEPTLPSQPLDYRRPRAGAVPVRIESDGDPLTVALTNPYAHPASFSRYGIGGAFEPPTYPPPPPPLCTTPCTLYLRPGAHMLHMGGDGRRESDETIEVESPGSLLRFRSSSRGAQRVGQMLVLAGAVGVVTGAWFAYDAVAGGCSLGCGVTLPVGILIAGGLSLGVGIPLLLANRTGLADTRTMQRQARARWTVAAAPTTGGAFGAFGLAF